MFSGSYPPDDVILLLKRVTLDPTPVEEKERLIQSGKRHYSEMISTERLPSPVYLRVFHQALERQKTRFAAHLFALASRVLSLRDGPITLVSLARAGTPVGVLLTRIIRTRFHRPVNHYSVSIIRDRGIDENALRYIRQFHPAESLAFVDGWTGKGVIAKELAKSIRVFNERQGETIDPGLFAVADLCGIAAEAATSEDYLIPSSVLGCTISGLVSRSILNDSVIGHGDFHGCLYYEDWKEYDLSSWFVDTMMREIDEKRAVSDLPIITESQRSDLRRLNGQFLEAMRDRFGIRDVNHVKPGIGEATRVLLRRVPDRLLLRQPDHADVEHLRLLAEEKRVPIEIDPALPYLAAALIKEVGE